MVRGGPWSIGGYKTDDAVTYTVSDWLRSAYPDQAQYQEAFERRASVSSTDTENYNLPQQTITLKSGKTMIAKASGLALWAGFDHGSVGGLNLRQMGFIDYYRIPKAAYYRYLNDRVHDNKNLDYPHSISGTPTKLKLESTYNTITNDGTKDTQLIVTMLNEQDQWVSDTTSVRLDVISGPGVFPTGKSYTFLPGKTIQDGKAAIEFHSFYSGTTIVKASVPSNPAIAPAVITINTINTLGKDEGTEPAGFYVNPPKPE